MKPPLIESRGVSVAFSGKALLRRGGPIYAVRGARLSIGSNEIVGLVGESGSGKSTLGRTLLGIERPIEGEVLFEGRRIHSLSRPGLKDFRRRTAMVFQDPRSSLDPRMKVGMIIGEGLLVHGLASRRTLPGKVSSLIEKVGLSPTDAGRYPHAFSGGERQRIGIARALSLDPDFIVLDEPVSALDVSVQAGILRLLMGIKGGRSYLFISHDLAVVEKMSDRIAVMYGGRILESGSREDIFRRPASPYTLMLLEAVPGRGRLGRTRTEVPPAPSGCPFRTACSRSAPECGGFEPVLEEIAPGHLVACLRP